jgi:hypothetical protein
MATWHEITRDPEYQELSEQGKALVKQGFFEREISSDPEFKAFSPQTQKAVFDDFWQTPDDSGQGIVTSTLGSAARGFGEIVPGTLEGVGALTGITPISDLGESAREGLEYIAPVNPIYEQGIPAKVANVAGNVASIIGTSGVGGLVGKALGSGRAAAAGSAAARQALTNQAIQAGAKSALYGTGFAQGAAAKAAENERLGITGAEGYLNLLGGGISELAPEMLPFGSALETSAARRLLGGVDDAAGRVIPGIRMSAAQEAAEGGSTQVLSNLSTQLTAPTGVEAPGLFEGAGEAALWEGVGGAMFGAINKLGRTPPERQTAEQKAYAAELGAIPVNRKPPITPEESLENFNQGGISVVSPDGVVTTLPFNREDIRATNLPFNRDDIRATDLPFSREDIRPTQLPFNREDIRATELPFSRQNIRGLSQLGQPVPSPSQVIADTLLTNAVNVSSDATKATEAALAVVQGVAATAPVELPVPTVAPTVEKPSPAMGQIENLSQTITDSNGEIAPEMPVPPPTAEAGAGVGEAPITEETVLPAQPIIPLENAPLKIPEQESLLQEPQGRVESREAAEASLGDQLLSPAPSQKEVAPPITPQGTPTPATEGTVMPGGSAMERDVTKPEQMTPEEALALPKKANDVTINVQKTRDAAQESLNSWVDSRKDRDAFRKITDKYNVPLSDMYEVAQISKGKWGAGITHQHLILLATSDSKPVSAAAVDTYGIKLPQGYVKQGDLYVFSQPESPIQTGSRTGSTRPERGEERGETKALETQGRSVSGLGEYFSGSVRAAEPKATTTKDSGAEKGQEVGIGSVYQTKLNNQPQWAVQTSNKRGFGDYLFDTEEEALKAGEIERKNSQSRAKSIEDLKNKERQEAEKKASQEEVPRKFAKT